MIEKEKKKRGEKYTKMSWWCIAAKNLLGSSLDYKTKLMYQTIYQIQHTKNVNFLTRMPTNDSQR